MNLSAVKVADYEQFWKLPLRVGFLGADDIVTEIFMTTDAPFMQPWKAHSNWDFRVFENAENMAAVVEGWRPDILIWHWHHNDYGSHNPIVRRVFTSLRGARRKGRLGKGPFLVGMTRDSQGEAEYSSLFDIVVEAPMSWREFAECIELCLWTRLAKDGVVHGVIPDRFEQCSSSVAWYFQYKPSQRRSRLVAVDDRTADSYIGRYAFDPSIPSRSHGMTDNCSFWKRENPGLICFRWETVVIS
jgi:hypothetical protein